MYAIRVPPKVIGALAGFGAGALVSAIAFDIPEALAPSADLAGRVILAGPAEVPPWR